MTLCPFFFFWSFGCESMDNLLFVGLVNFGWLQQQVYTRWTECWTCSRRQLSPKIKCQAIPEEAVTIDNSTGFCTLNLCYQPQNLVQLSSGPKSIGFCWNFFILSSVWITENDIRNLHSDHGVFDLFHSFGSRWWRGGNGGREKLCQSRLMGHCLPKRGEVPQRDWGAWGNACNWRCIGCWCNWEDTKGEFLWCYCLHCR